MTDIDSITDDQPISQELSRIEAPLERRRVGDMTVDRFAGLTFAEYRECVEFAKLMAQGRHSIPAYLKANPGDCLSIVTQAMRWHLEPYWVAQHSYIAKQEAMIAYDAAVHAAIVISAKLTKERPEYIFEGEGEDRICTVSATFKGEKQPKTYTTPPLRQCRPPKNQDGIVKGSPLWTKDPDQQLGYYAVRNWGRRHCPEVLGGVYDREEFEETTQAETDVIPPSPNLAQRLPQMMADTAGFQTDVVDNGLAAAAAEVQEAKAATRKPAGRPAAGQEKADAPAAPEPAPKAKPPSKPREPTTAGDYMDYAAKWIEKITDEADIDARWDGEIELRERLKVPAAASKRLLGMMKARQYALQMETKKQK
jgi:hypothetical protein